MALLPALLVTVGLFGGGVLLAVAQSLGFLPFAERTSLSVDAYRAVFALPEFWSSLGLTLWIAGAATSLSAVLGVLLALALRGVSPGSPARLLFVLGLPVPHVVAAFVTLLMLSQSGLVSRVTRVAGLTAEPRDFPALVFDPLAVGVIAELVWKETPFIGLSALAALALLDSRLEEAARVLGASPVTRLRRVVWPAIRPAVAASSLLVFAFALSSFEVPLLLGATSPTTLPVLAYRAFTDVDLARRDVAMAISVVVTLIGGVVAVAYVRFARGVYGTEST